MLDKPTSMTELISWAKILRELYDKHDGVLIDAINDAEKMGAFDNLEKWQVLRQMHEMFPEVNGE